MGMRVRLIRHEAVPKCGSYEIRFPDGRASRFVYWDDIPKAGGCGPIRSIALSLSAWPNLRAG
jgi:hypothetical protein